MSVANRALNSDCAETDDDHLALAFLSLRFLSASKIFFWFKLSYQAPLLMRQRHFVRSCVVNFQDSVGILKSLSEALSVSFGHLVSAFLPAVHLQLDTRSSSP